MIHISVKCDFCGEPYKDDLNETFDIACYPQDILCSLKRIRERATYRYWIYSPSNKRWYCPKCAKERKAYEGKLAYLNNKEDVKHDLMMKLKDEGIVRPLKDSILRNERLSSQEQQELCAWIECAMDFGENLDECATELEYAKTIIQDLLNNSDEYARERAINFLREQNVSDI